MNKQEFSIWLAGFFDGEGNILFTKGKYPAVRIQISQKDRGILEYIRDNLLLPSNIYLLSTGCFILGFQAKKDVLYFLDLVFPYLKVKKTQAQKAYDHLLK